MVLGILISIQLIPYGITILFPNLCYGCTSLGKKHQEMNAAYRMGDILWISYIILFIYGIILASSMKNKILKYTIILVCVYLIYLPVWPILVIMNYILSLFYRNPPFIHDYHTIFPASLKIEKNAGAIIDEFLSYTKEHTPSCLRETNHGFKIETNSTPENCWRAIHLKKIGKINTSMEPYFPTTIQSIKDPQIHNAFFSILDPGVEIPPHVGYYKGYLRYHLGVVIPENTNEKAYLVCGGEKYIWKTYEGVVFDDLYLHHVKNPTHQKRVVLYLDIKRKSDSSLVRGFNEVGIYLIENSLLLNLFLKNQHRQQKIDDSGTG